MGKQINNNSGQTRNYAGQLVLDQASYLIQDAELSSFQVSNLLLADLASSNSSLTDTVANVEYTGSEAVKFLLDNPKKDMDGYPIHKLGGIHDPSGLRARLVGTHFGTITAGNTISLDWQIPSLAWLGLNKQCYLDGVEYHAENSKVGDHVTFQVVDKDGLVYPANTVLEEFASNFYVMPNLPNRILLYKGKLIAGFYLRIVYVSTGTVNVNLVANIFRHLGENENV